MGRTRPTAQPEPRWSSVVSGLVRREDGQPLQGQRVRAVHEATAGSLRLGEDNTDAEGRYTIRYEPLPEVDGINLRVTVFNADGKPPHQSEVIRQAKPLEIVNFTVPSSDLKEYRVEGKVTSRVRASLSGLRVVIVDKGVGGDVQLVQATTDDGGAYGRSSRTTICNGAARRIPTCKRAFLQAIPIWALRMFAITRPNTRS